MKKRYCRLPTLMMCLVLTILLLCAGTASAEMNTGFLGKPFPEFTATDTEGNTFTLSEALKDHKAVLINLWATWCGPCLYEFPFLSEVCEKYDDRVAFIALSVEPRDTIENIAEYRKKNDVLLPMGRDEGEELYQYIQAAGIPDTIVVDRFGNAAFYRSKGFRSAEDVGRVLDAFLGEDYKETVVLNEIPRDASTQAYPVSAARALYPVGGSYRKALIHVDGFEKPFACWIIPDESVVIRAEVAADDDVSAIMYEESYSGVGTYIKNILNPETNVYSFKQSMPQPKDEYQYVRISLFDGTADMTTEKDIISFLAKDEEGLESLVDGIKSDGYAVSGWEYADENATAENGPQAYIIHVVDQDNKPVEEVVVNFCTDVACTPSESDGNGTVTYNGEPDVYHVQIVDVPEGYSWDESYDMYTTREYGEWVLRVRKD